MSEELKHMILYGTVFKKVTMDSEGNVIHKEIISPENLNKQDYDAIEITEYYKRKET